MKLYAIQFFEDLGNVFLKAKVHETIAIVSGEDVAKAISDQIAWEKLYSVDYTEIPHTYLLIFYIPGAFVAFHATVQGKSVEFSQYSLEYCRCKHCIWLEECRVQHRFTARTRACANLQLTELL